MDGSNNTHSDMKWSDCGETSSFFMSFKDAMYSVGEKITSQNYLAFCILSCQVHTALRMVQQSISFSIFHVENSSLCTNWTTVE